MNLQQRIFLTIFYTLSFSATASSPDYTSIIHKLAVYENTVYAEVKYTHPYLDEETSYFYSTNGGRTWEEVDFELPSQAIHQLTKGKELPLRLCLLKNQDICYQAGNESILESNDGGKTWLSSWSLPDGRREFLIRKSAGEFNLGPFDIVHVELDNQQIIIAALGTEGLIIKIDNDEWEYVGISGAGSMYFNAKSFEEAKNITRCEFLISCFIFFFLFYINLRLNITIKKKVMQYLLSFFPLLTIALFISLFFFANKESSNLLVGLSLIFLICLFIMIIVTLQQFLKNTNKPAKSNLITIILVVLISYYLFVLWAYGTIPVYETALWAAISLHILLLLWILYLPIKESIQTKSSRSKRDLPE